MKRFLLVLFLLSACAPRLAPTATPAPNSGAETPGLYPAASPAEVRAVLEEMPPYTAAAYQEFIPPQGQALKAISARVVSAGIVEQITISELDITLDVVWVFQRNAAGVAYFPLVVGAQSGEEYLPYYTRYSGERERAAYMEYLHVEGILERGRFLMPGLAGEYLDRLQDIDWQACGDSLLCRVGGYMQERYGLDHLFIAQLALQIPAGWALAWPWDAATELNSQVPKITLPEVGDED